MISSSPKLENELLIPPLPSVERGVSVVFDSDSVGERIIYAHGKSIYIRNLQNPLENFCYSEHTYQCTVAKFSPSGFYIASADVAGNVKIWDATQPSHLLKAEYRVIGGPIKDLAWDHESKHLIAVGEGREKFAHAFLFDTGSSLGEVIGHTKVINSVSIRPQRPLRAVTASDDFTVNFFSGTPYKFVKSIKDHSRFVQCVRFSPDGSFFASAGADGKVFIYDGESGDLVKELEDPNLSSAHASAVMALSWSQDSTHLVSSSADKSNKIWNVKEGKLVISKTFQFSESNQHENQVLGNLWTPNGIVIQSLSGKFALLHPGNGEILEEYNGHSKGLTALFSPNPAEMYSASYDGAIFKWSLPSLKASELTSGSSLRPCNQVECFTASQSGPLFFLSPNDQKLFKLDSKIGLVKDNVDVKKISFVHDKMLALLSLKGLQVMDIASQSIVASISLPETPTSLQAREGLIAVGFGNKTVHIYSLNLTKLEVVNLESVTGFGLISALAFSPDGQLLALGDDQRRIKVFSTANWGVQTTNWCYHNARISSLAWSSDSKYLLSASLDNSLMLWSLSSPIKPVVAVQNAHSGPIVEVVSLGENRFASASQDASIRIWKIL